MGTQVVRKVSTSSNLKLTANVPENSPGVPEGKDQISNSNHFSDTFAVSLLVNLQMGPVKPQYATSPQVYSTDVELVTNIAENILVVGEGKTTTKNGTK